MRLTHHHYATKPSRYFIDGKRVSAEAYDFAIVLARIRNRQHGCFVTRMIRSAPQHHVIHYSTIR